MRRFRSSVFCGKGELPLVPNRPFNFQELLHAQEPENTKWKENNEKA